MVRLANDVVVGRHLTVLGYDRGGAAVPAADLPPGSAVAVGPADADEPRLRSAVLELRRLVEAGGPAAAGADVDLRGGFRSARLDGARGDRRDAVLAALRALGTTGADRLGDRAGMLVALFGPAVTKPVGAATARAVDEGRWPAVQLASAASDLLGPEQLEVLLRLDAGPGIDPMQGVPPSTLAGHLARALGPLPRPRRLDVLLDLWDRVRATRGAALRRDRLLALGSRRDRLDDVRRRYAAHEDELLLEHVRLDVGHDPSLAEAARWTPPVFYWAAALHRAVQNAVAATALLRAAVHVSDHGVREGLARCADELAAAAELLNGAMASRAARRVAGQPGLPARPGCYVRELHAKLRRDELDDPRTEAFVNQRLARARDYAIVVLEAATVLLHTAIGEPCMPASDQAGEGLSTWIVASLRDWRRTAGYSAARPPEGWAQLPLFAPGSVTPATLAERLAACPDARPEDVETAGDLLWYADLADALAEAHGHRAATIDYETPLPNIDYDPAPPEPAPLRPRLDSLPQAAAGAAQLVALGGAPPPRPRTWPDLVDGLLADAAIAEALTGGFRLPAPLAALDGTAIPGTGARVEWARDPRTLAGWSAYMGNCIAGPWYVDEAAAGRCGLAALRNRDGRIVANMEVRPARPRTRGWRIVEIEGRFNTDLDPDLLARVRRWVAALPPPAPAPVAVAPTRDRAARPARRGRPADRLQHEVAGPLARLAERAMADRATVAATDLLSELAARPADDPAATLTALHRMTPDRLARACAAALPDLGLAGLWTATAVRPLAAALARLDPRLREHHESLALTLEDQPLPRSLRRLVRQPAIAPARSMELVTRRVRAALGRLARAQSPELARAVARQADTAALCTMTIATTSWATDMTGLIPVTRPGQTTVPGFPRSSLAAEDGPWRRSFPAARELGADIDEFWRQVAEAGLQVPAAWLPNAAWPALWNRAATHSPRRG